MKPIIECVPNFSEGRNPAIIQQIADAITQVEGVKLLNVDSGKATNRTVMTFVGAPEAVLEAAFRSIKRACELIDMTKHSGEHPRMGATDVCPLIPIADISMEEVARYARQLGKRVGEELGIPVYLYEKAAIVPGRTNLSDIRSGEYEGFFEKIKKPEWKPDFGPEVFPASSGATVIGARDFLIAYNVNLNTTSLRRANAIAFDVREKGRVKREGDPITGKIVTNANGEPEYIPGTLKSVKAIGWFIEEYGVAQISMNLTDISVTPLHIAFDEVCKKAEARGIRVTGSELVGLVPLKAMLDAGRYFLQKQQRSLGVDDAELIKIAIKSMGLEELGPFDPQKRIIEYLLEAPEDQSLVHKTVNQFVNLTASELPAPGGGSVAALNGALSASLACMVANLSAHKKGWDHQWEYFSSVAEQLQQAKKILLAAIDEDTAAFNAIMNAFGLPKSNDAEKAIRRETISSATRQAIEVPLKVCKLACELFPLIEQMIDNGNPNSVSDAAVAAINARAAVHGAAMNVRINLSGYKDDASLAKMATGAIEQYCAEADTWERKLLSKTHLIINASNA